MKKFFSISLIILTVVTMLHLTVATHWCSGRIAATRVSLTGKTADCGMEDSKNCTTSSDLTFTSHCCKNVVVTYGVNSNYFPSFQIVPCAYQQELQHFNIPERIAVRYFSSLKLYSDKSPPNDSFYQRVDLSEICILRI